MEPRLEASDSTQIDGQEIEEQGPFGLRRQRDEFAARVRRNLVINVLEIRRLPTETRSVLDDFAVDLARGVVDHGHGRSLLAATEEAIDLVLGLVDPGGLEPAGASFASHTLE